MPTAAVTTALAQISQYLWTAQINKDNAFNNGSINNGRDLVLYSERKALQYAISQGLSTTATNYIYALIGAKLQLANQVYSAGSSGVVPTPSGGISGYVPYPINIIVTAGQAGGMTLNATTPSDWIGLVLFTQCTIDQNPLGLNVQFTYNIVTGTFDFSLYNYTIQAGQNFICNAFKAV